MSELNPKNLGKIKSARFGCYDGHYGFHFSIDVDGSNVGHSFTYGRDPATGTVNHNTAADALIKVHKLLADAKVNCLHELEGVPVLIIGERCAADFRILTEVL